jgi:hypothetical protein
VAEIGTHAERHAVPKASVCVCVCVCMRGRVEEGGKVGGCLPQGGGAGGMKMCVASKLQQPVFGHCRSRRAQKHFADMHTHTHRRFPLSYVHDTNNLPPVQLPTPVHGGKGLAKKLGKALKISSLKDEGENGLLWYSCSSVLVISLGPTREAHLEASVYVRGGGRREVLHVVG